MSITLQKLWGYPAESLRPVLLSKGRDLTDNLQFDRAVVATIYFNANMLAPIDRQWVANPQFAAAAKQTKDLDTLIQVLKRPFANKFMVVDTLLFSIENMAKQVVADDAKHSVVGWNTRNRDTINPVYVLTANGFNYTEGKYDDSKASFTRTFTGLLGTVVGERESHYGRFDRDAQLRNVDELIKQYYFEYYWPTISAMRAASVGIPEEAKANPDTFLAALDDTALKAATQVKAAGDNRPLALEADKVPISSRIFDFTDVMTPLLDFDISGMERVARCYYLYLMWDLLSEVPPIPQRDALVAKLDALIKRYGYEDIFADTYLTIPSGLSPVFGTTGGPTKTSLTQLIGEFAGQPPTRAEVLTRIAAM